MKPGRADAAAKLRVCVAGVSGWVGAPLTRAILGAPGFALVGAVSRTHAGHRVREVIGAAERADVQVSATVESALSVPTDVLIDYTGPTVVKRHVLTAVDAGVSVVIGTSGLDESDYAQIDVAARRRGVGVIAGGNFAITAVLLSYLSRVAAQYLPAWEVIDYADASKVDAPSGTARELVAKLHAVRSSRGHRPPEETVGDANARGATILGTQVHSLRLPGFAIGVEALFGQQGEQLQIRYTGGGDATPYIAGTLLAATNVQRYRGLQRGLDQLLDLPGAGAAESPAAAILRTVRTV